eukprot:scaffold649_cov347-Pavlova_lutheri.AAC.153
MANVDLSIDKCALKGWWSCLDMRITHESRASVVLHRVLTLMDGAVMLDTKRKVVGLHRCHFTMGTKSKFGNRVQHVATNVLDCMLRTLPTIYAVRTMKFTGKGTGHWIC